MDPGAGGDLALGLDIGCTNLKGVVVTRHGKVLLRESRSTPGEPEGLVASARDLVGRCRDELGREPRWIGLSAPGLAAADGRSIAWMEGRNQGMVGLDWGEALGREAPVLNDGHAAVLGEAWLGAAVGRSHVLMLTLGTGVGGGILVDGKLLLGHLGRGGHAGHTSLDPEGEPDICRTPGSLESAIGDVTVKQRSGGRFEQTRELVAAAAAGDAEAEAVWRRSIRALACGLASLINVLDPEVVVLGGGVVKAGEQLFGPLREEMERVEWRPLGKPVPLVAAELGDLAGALGAARHAMDAAQAAPR